jgi:exosortase
MMPIPDAQQGPAADSSRAWVWIAVGVAAFAPALLALARIWSSVPYYAHGFLVPVFAGAAAYGVRDQLVPAPRASRAGAGWAAVFGAYLAGLAAGSASLQGLALIGAVATGVYQLWGRAGVRTLAFPLFFLVFMVPLPGAMVDPFIRWLQGLVSWAAVAVLHGIGAEVIREGNILHLASGEALFVADACSGITSLITLTPLAVALAWYTENRWAPRAWILVSVIPLAMAANLLRVVGTTLAVERWGIDPVMNSPWHDMSGLATFALACFGLLAVSGWGGRRHDAEPA